LLPSQQGRGRRRRYCDARCRSAARRKREASRQRQSHDVNYDLTRTDRHESLYTVEDLPRGADPVAIRVSDAARRLVEELAGAGSPLAAMGAARELSAATDGALQAAVDRARAAGHSWREIGDVLETTRQAAFQRFGRPVDPRTGQPMIRSAPPGRADEGVAVLAALIEGRFDDVRQAFEETRRQQLETSRLASAWAHTIGQIGRYERMGEPSAYPVDDDITAVDIPLFFEAGERTGRVVFDRDGQVVGLFLRPAPT
jgi:Protein of unknown function (DUF3887)